MLEGLRDLVAAPDSLMHAPCVPADPGNVRAVESDDRACLAASMLAGQQVEQRCLAGTIGSNDAKMLRPLRHRALISSATTMAPKLLVRRLRSLEQHDLQTCSARDPAWGPAACHCIGSADWPASHRRPECRGRSGCPRSRCGSLPSSDLRHCPPTSGVLVTFFWANGGRFGTIPLAIGPTMRVQLSVALRWRRCHCFRIVDAVHPLDHVGHRPRTAHGRNRAAVSTVFPSSLS